MRINVYCVSVYVHLQLLASCRSFVQDALLLCLVFSLIKSYLVLSYNPVLYINGLIIRVELFSRIMNRNICVL